MTEISVKLSNLLNSLKGFFVHSKTLYLKTMAVLAFLYIASNASGVPLTLAIPDLNEAISVYSRWDSLADYLKGKSGYDIRIKLVNSQRMIEDGFKKHTLSFAFVDPFWFVRMEQEKLCNPVARVVVGGNDFFRSILIVNRDSIFRDISDLRGKTVALVNPMESSAGYFLPSVMLKLAGLEAKDFGSLIFSDSYMSVLKGVSFGKLDAGFVSSSFLRRKEALPFKSNIRIIMKSEEIPQWLIVARYDLDSREINSLRNVFMEMNKDDNGRALLLTAGFDGFKQVNALDYKKIKKYSKYLEFDFVSSE